MTFSLTFHSEGQAGSPQLEGLFRRHGHCRSTTRPRIANPPAPRLTQQSKSVTFPATQPDPPQRRLKIGVFPELDTPQAAFTDGDLLTCDFAVAAEATIGTQVDLTVPVGQVQVVRSNLSVLCGSGSGTNGGLWDAGLGGVHRGGSDSYPHRHTGTADEHAGATDEHAGATDEHAGATDEHAGATDEHAGAADEHAGAADEHVGAADKHAGATDEHAGRPDEHAGAA